MHSRRCFHRINVSGCEAAASAPHRSRPIRKRCHYMAPHIKAAQAMNINYEIPDDLHRALKVKAAQEGKTLKALIIELLRRIEEVGDD